MSENYACMRLLKQVDALKNAEIIFGSSFPQDLEYTQVCRDINKIKVCMDKGRPVILLNLEQLYESLYDLLNQAFIELADKNFVDLGLGTHRFKCHVHKDFRLVVVAERMDALTRFPLALLNRLEKHFVTSMDKVNMYQQDAVDKLNDWAELFADIKYSNSCRKLEPADVFIGYHVDTVMAIVEEICAKENKNIINRQGIDEVFQLGKRVLLQSAIPDAVVRLRYTDLHSEIDDLWNIYFKEQAHSSFFDYLSKEVFEGQRNSELNVFNQVTTHSQLFSHSDNAKLAAYLNFNADQVTIVTLQIYNTQQEFQKRITDIVKLSGDNSHLIVVQCLAGDQNEKLIACSRYILENVAKSEEFQGNKVKICLLIGLPRKAGGCFSGFPNFGWHCSHIDELAPQEEHLINFDQLINKSIADLLNDFLNDVGCVNFDSIVKDSLQLATSYIRDDTNRKLERLDVLQKLWIENVDFRTSFYKWLQQLLNEQQQSDSCGRANDWLFTEATKTSAILEHRTYKHALYKSIENVLVPFLGGLICSIDRGDNLDLISSGNNNQKWACNLWLKLFSDRTFLDLHHNSDAFLQRDGLGRQFPRHEFFIALSSSKMHYRVPFFWLIKEKAESILNDFNKTSGACNVLQIKEQCADVLKNTDWGQAILNAPGQFLPAYIHDFILSIYTVHDESSVSNLLMEWLAQASGLANCEQHSTPVILCPLFHQALNIHMRNFVDMAKLFPEIADILMKAGNFSKYCHAFDLLAIEIVINSDKFTSLSELVKNIDPISSSLIVDVQKRNRSKFVTLVKTFSTLVQSIFVSYQNEISSGGARTRIVINDDVKQLLNKLRKDWFAADVCASFLQETVAINVPLFVKGLWNECRSEKAERITSEKFWNQLESSMKLWTKQLLMHYFKNSLDRYSADRSLIMNFFTAMIYELFNGSMPPSEKVLENLMTYVTYKYDTGRLASQELSPFPDENAVDISPVVRSFLLQLILSQNLSLVLGHIDIYLNSARRLLNSEQAIMKDFIWMCISCTEDSLYGKYFRNFSEESLVDISGISFVRQNIPTKTSCNDLGKITSEDIEILARCRFVLSVFVDLIIKHENHPGQINIHHLNESVKRLLSGEGACKEAKLLLLKLICRRQSVEFARHLKSDEFFCWIVDGIDLEENDIPDPFVLYGDYYCAVKSAFNDYVFVKDMVAFEKKIKVKS